MGPFRAALFDLDGTIVDSADDILAALAHTIRMAGLDADPDPEAGRAHLGHPLHVMLGRMGYSVPPESNEELMGLYAPYYMRHWKDRTRIFAGVEPLLASLKGLPMAVVTQKRQIQAQGMLEAFGLEAYFLHAVGLQPGFRPKPAPDLLLHAAELLGTLPRQMVMVGDSELDVEAGRAAEMATVGVTWGFGARERLESAGADVLVDEPKDLLGILGGPLV